MGLYNVLRTGVSGMNAQTAKLGAVADNVANSATTGYKRSTMEFSTLLAPQTGGGYESGSVESRTRQEVAAQGAISYTSSGTDLAISGNGFFVVADGSGTPYLTRAGNFVIDGPSGDLINAAGFTLLGRPISNGDSGGLLNSAADLVPVNFAKLGMQAAPSTIGAFTGNLPADAEIIANPPPASTDYSKKSSLMVYDDIGHEVRLDIYVSKSAQGEWQVALYDGGDAAAFPASPLGQETLTFDASGQLNGASSITVNVPNGQPFTLDMKGLTQLAGDYNVTGSANGNAPSPVKGAEFGSDGVVYAVYENGTRVAAFEVPLATVASPDNLTPRAGNVYEASSGSGEYQMGMPGKGGLGSIVSGALESSTVDLGTELTLMIEAQTAFSANSKTFQTGNEMIDVVLTLKR